MVIIEAVIKATDKYYSIVKTAVERDHVFIGVFPEHLRDIINDFNKTFFAARRLVIPDKKLHIVNGNTYESKATWDVYGLLLEDWEKVEKNLWGKIETCPIKREQVRFSLEWYNRDDNLGEDYFNNLSRYLREMFSLDVSPADLASAGDGQGKNDKPKGGRPRNPDDDWALDEVRTKNRSPESVYPEWLKRIGDRANTLADTRDSFNKAIRPERKKE